MNARRVALGLALLALALGCEKKGRSGKPDPTDSPSPSPSQSPLPQVTAILASATLADDCGKTSSADDVVETTTAAVAAAKAPANRPAGGALHSNATMTADQAKMGRCAGPNCFRPSRRACQQTTMQLTLTTADKSPVGGAEVVKVELLDEATKESFGDLAPRNPTVWVAGSYRPWDGTVAPGDSLNVSYQLSAPNWSDAKLGGSRAAAAGKSFLLRVTLRIAGRDQTIDRVVQSAPVMVEPHVVT